MNTKWYIGTTNEEQKLERAELIKACKPALDVLKSILIKDKEEADASGASIPGYDNAAWAYFQADRVGMLRTYKAIIDLIP